jgi:hypothetical protein
MSGFHAALLFGVFCSQGETFSTDALSEEEELFFGVVLRVPSGASVVLL